MNLIKLDAIDSTNEYLKELSKQNSLENYTVVTAENQTKGKGQMGAIWDSEKGKNFIMSILIKEFLLSSNDVFQLSMLVSVSVIQALETLEIPNLKIKWPNDILSDSKKIGGILIENSFKNDGVIVSVVGIGLNVNQINFDLLPKASSMKVITNQDFDRNSILELIVKTLKDNIEFHSQFSNQIEKKYIKSLFKFEIPMPFQDLSNHQFMGIIKGVSKSGKIQIQVEDNSINEFEIKEIQMLY